MPETVVAERFSSPAESPNPSAPEQSGETALASTPAPADRIAPADLEPRASWAERLGWYGGATVLTCVLLFFGLRLDQADLGAPFYYDLDSLLILPFVKATLERGPGGHWHNDRLGAPWSLDLHDFPVIDHLHFFLIWLLGLAVSNVIVVYNLYYLLTFPLTTLTAMTVFRSLRLTLPAAAVGGLLYSFLPYHYQRWENHYFLSAYWLIPVALLPVFSICQGKFPFFRRREDGAYERRLLTWDALWLVVLGAAIASAGAYYAFFTCAFIAFAGAYTTLRERRWRAIASALALVGVIVVFGVANHIPTFIYQAKYGRNPVTNRYPEEADNYGLKITQMLLPVEDHNLTSLARLKWMYESSQRIAENENKSAALGVIGSLGLLYLLGAALFQFRLGWPYAPLAALTLFGVGLATIGGFGSIFNLIVTPQIRAYNRISVFIAFFCFFAILWAIDRFLARPRSVSLLLLSYSLFFVWLVLIPVERLSQSGRERISRLRERLRARSVPVKWIVWPGVLLIGFLDQTPYAWFKSGIIKTLSEQARRFHADAQFFHEIERTMPAGARIFCLPYVPYPENPPVARLAAYEHVRGYIHTQTLAWSYGGMKGRESDEWQLEVTSRGTLEMLQRIVYRGFEGLVIDKRGYGASKDSTNRAFAYIHEINDLYASLASRRNARLPEIVHEDGQQVFLDLRPYRDALKALSPELYEAKVREEENSPIVLWLNGFYNPGTIVEDRSFRFGPTNAKVWIINPAQTTRTFNISMILSPVDTGVFGFAFSGLVTDEFSLERKVGDWEAKRYGAEKRYRIEVPPGRHTIRIRCYPPDDFLPDDRRNLSYYVKDFKIEEVREGR
jgi:hypothetical protein